MKLRLTGLLAALCFSLPLRADWQRPTVNFTRSRYAAGSQNWMIAQHPDGWLYFANNKGLLEFDGEIWSTYSMNGEKARSLCIDRDSTVYVGGMRQFGRFSANRLGGLDYRCLSDSLTRHDRINVVWNVHASDDRIYFQTDWEIHCYYKSGDSIRTVSADRNIKRSALIGGKLYVADATGLSVLNGERFLPLPDTRAIGAFKIVALLPFDWYGGGNVLIVTEKNGLYVYDGRTTTPFATPADGFLARNRLFCAAIDRSTLALGSIQNGVQIVDLATGRTENISTGNGLQNKTILSVAFDRNGDLWLGLDNGIDYVRMNSVRADLYGGKPVIGSGYASCIYDGRIYYGTNQGLYSSRIATSPGNDIDMKPIDQIGGQIWNLSVHDGRLFCSADAGLYVISRRGIEQVPGIRGVWTVVATNRPDRLLAGTYVGLHLLVRERDGRWRVSHRIEGVEYSCKNLFVENGSVVWTSNKGDGLHRLTLSDDYGSLRAEKSFNNDLIPKDRGVSFSYIAGDLVIATLNGLFRYDQIKDTLEPCPELERRLKGKAFYRLLRQTADGTIWYAVDESLYCLRGERNRLYLRNALVSGFEHVDPLDASRILVATEDGFVSFDVSRIRKPRSTTHVHVRQLFFRERHDSLVYGRNYGRDSTPLRIPYSKNSLRFVCSADNYSSPHHKLYSYRLSCGDEGVWTEYGESNSKEYTELKAGNYLFEVRVPETDAAGAPVIDSLAFRILPPWYRSPVMYGLYLLFVAGLSVFLYKYTYGRQRAIVRRQQQEMKQKSREIKHLEEENIRAELRHKTEELARTTLNIVRKNEILQKIRKEAGNILRAAKEEDIVHIRRSTTRLIDNIDTNLEHDNDIKNFEETFDSIHRDFFKHLDECCPRLSKQEKMVCAYIRIGMLSKEIAPLLNISVRGVEIGRYRLRRKLGLEEGTSLTDFLQKL